MCEAWVAVTTLVSPRSSWIGHQPHRYPVEKRKHCFHGSSNIHILASEVILLKTNSVRAGALDFDIYHYGV